MSNGFDCQDAGNNLYLAHKSKPVLEVMCCGGYYASHRVESRNLPTIGGTAIKNPAWRDILPASEVVLAWGSSLADGIEKYLIGTESSCTGLCAI